MQYFITHLFQITIVVRICTSYFCISYESPAMYCIIHMAILYNPPRFDNCDIVYSKYFCLVHVHTWWVGCCSCCCAAVGKFHCSDPCLWLQLLPPREEGGGRREEGGGGRREEEEGGGKRREEGGGRRGSVSPRRVYHCDIRILLGECHSRRSITAPREQ